MEVGERRKIQQSKQNKRVGFLKKVVLETKEIASRKNKCSRMSNATDDHCIWHVRDINDLDKNASGGVVEMKA